MRYVLILLALVFLSACNGSEPEPDADVTSASTPQYYINPNSLPSTVGNWTLQPDTITYEDQQSMLLYAGTYQYQEAGTARILLRVFRSSEEAQRVVQDELGQWRAEVNNTITEIDALGNESYILNQNVAGLSRVMNDGVMVITTDGERPYSDLEFLALMQIGVNILSERSQPGSGGSMGSSTRVPVPTAED